MSANSSQPQRSALFYKLLGSPFQLIFVISFVYRSVSLRHISDTTPFAVKIVNLGGMILFVYCLKRIYIKRPQGLMTDGAFRYTRHPMYTGILMMAVRLWWPTHQEDWLMYFGSLGQFLFGVFVAGYMQEKETIARFGQDCLDYYARTPRLFLLYPFRKRG